MNILEETILKNIFIAEKALKKDEKKYTNKLVFSKVLSFSKIPRDYNEILEILKGCLKQTNFRWVNLMFYAEFFIDESHIHPHANIKIFLFGETEFILDNIKDIVKRIVDGTRWIGEKAGISSLREFSIKDFI